MQKKFLKSGMRSELKYEGSATVSCEDGDILKESVRRVIMFFAGWGMDDAPFVSVEKPGYDILFIYDYNDEGFDLSAVEGYDEICVVAWSLGVWHAGRFMKNHPELPFTRAIAVNGTLNPIDDMEGIPPRIYDLTSRLPDENALLKFYRRICGGQEGMRRLMPQLPQRDLDDLRNELIQIRQRIAQSHSEADVKTSDEVACSKDMNDSVWSDDAQWDEIYLSDNDMIFPFENMKRSWANAAGRVRILEGESHAIDFKQFISTSFVDKPLISERFAAASETYNAEATVQHAVAKKLIDTAREFLDAESNQREILEIGSGVGVLTALYQPLFRNSNIYLWDLSPSSVAAVNDNNIEVNACDAELEIRKLPAASVDVIFSSSTIQWFNSPRRFIKQLYRVLKPGGIAFISYYIEGTLPQIALIDNANAMHYPYLEDMLARMDDVSCTTFTEKFELAFETPTDALAHLRATGVNSIGRGNMSVAGTRRLMKLITVDRKAVLTFNTRFIIMKKNG